MSVREDSIIFLLGAGASVDAGIKHAQQMTDDIESKVTNTGEFYEFKDLYNYLKSSIIYQRGLEGIFGTQNATIEDLLNVLAEINQKHKNKLYPFIGGWNVHLSKVAGDDFIKISKLDKLIRDQLFRWINIKNYDSSEYFKNFGELAKEIGSPLRVFTLNYDLCVEKSLERNGASLELGFNERREWEASRFDRNENTETDVYLYKLHGSIDWIRDKDHGHILTKCDSPQDNPELIFGTTAKLSSIDPFLFYVHEFRKYSLQEPLRIIVTIGYSYSDDYINRLIGQSLMRNKNSKIISVAPISNSSPNSNHEAASKRIGDLIGASGEWQRIVIEDCTAKEFFNEKMLIEYFEKISDSQDDIPF